MEILQFYPTAAIVKYQRLGDINNQNLFSHGSGGSKSVSWCQQVGFGEQSLSGL